MIINVVRRKLHRVTIEEEHDAGKGRELERITAEERRNEPRPDTERDCHDEDVDRDDGEGDGGEGDGGDNEEDEVEENQVEENGENGLDVEEENCEDLSQYLEMSREKKKCK